MSVLKKAGSAALTVACITATLLIAVLFLHGIVWVSEKALPWLTDAGDIAFVICLIIFLPISIFRKTRPLAGIGFFVASYVFGVVLFAFSCVVDYLMWGYTGLIVGLLFMGVGVVPIAILATILHGMWSLLANVILGLFLTIGARIFGAYLMAVGERRKAGVYA